MAAFGQDSPTMMANIERGNTMEGREIERLRARVAELDAERDLAYEREAHAIATVASDESIIANLRTRVTELEALLSTQWPGRDVVAQITKGTSYLLAECNYDWDGWEQLQAARDEAVAWLALRGEDAP